MRDPNSPRTKLDKIKAWVVSITGVLVVLPALVNGGLDIYASLQKLPKTESERINVELFKKYFNKQPIAQFPVPIKQNNGVVDVNFSVYEEGDVFVEFGKFTQWFPFPSQGGYPAIGHASLISQSMAQQAFEALPSPKGMGNYQQTERYEEGMLVRKRLYNNNVEVRQVLDPRKGDILESSARTLPQAKEPPQPALALVAPIDLDALRKKRVQPLPAKPYNLASVCSTRLGNCQLLVGLSLGEKCSCQGISGPVAGVSKNDR